MLFGQAPEVLDDASLGFYPWTGTGESFTLKPESVDVLALPTFGAGALSLKAGKSAAKPVARALARTAEAPMDVGRRNFMKKAGAAGAIAATPKIVLDAAEHVLPRAALPKAAAKVAAKAAVHHGETAYDLMHGALQMMKKSAEKLEKNAVYEEPLHRQHRLITEMEENGLDPILELYDPDELEKIGKLLMEVPESERLNRYLMATGSDLADYSKPEKWVKKIGSHKDYDSRMVDQANAALEKYSPEEIDRWLFTGEMPKDFPEELLPHMDYTDLVDKGDVFGYSASANPGMKLERLELKKRYDLK